MEIRLKEYPVQVDNLSSIEKAYDFYYGAYKELKKIISGEYNNHKIWNIIKKRYYINLFNDMENAIDTCKQLDIKNVKKLKTEYLKCKLDENRNKKYFFEDWLVIENKKFDSRQVYNDDEIFRMEILDDITVLCDKGLRSIDEDRLEIKNEDALITIIYVDGKYAGCKIGDWTSSRNEDDITTYRYCVNYDLDEHPEMKKAIIEKSFNYDRLMNDINTLRFKVLEMLKLARNISEKYNININKQLEEKRLELK